MAQPPDLQRLPLDDLARGCAQESERFRLRLEQDARFCFEIFRRAIADADGQAWTIFAEQYHFQIARWAQRHPGFTQCGESVDDLVAHVLTKLWQTFATNKHKLNQFNSFQSLMAYCKMCVHSEVVDALRTNKQTAAELDESMEAPAPNQTPDQQLWDYVLPRLKDEQERLVIQGLFLYGMTPKDLWNRFRSRFSDMSEIYRVKQNVIARLRRDAAFRQLFGADD